MRSRFLIFGLLATLWGSNPAALADQYSQEISIYRNKAVEAQFTGNPDLALENYEQALKIAKSAYGPSSPFLAEIYYDMGALCLNSSKFNKAEDYLNQTVKLNPNSTAAHLSLAELMRLKGRPDEAVKHAGTVVAKHRDDVVARHELALAYHGNDDSLREYRELSAMDRLVQHEREKYAGKETGGFELPKISFAPISLPVPKPVVSDPAPKATVPAPAKEDPAKKEKDKKAQQKAEQDKKKALQKAEQDKKKAQQKAEQDKKKAEQAKKKKPAPAAMPVETTASTEPVPSTGVPAKLRSKAVLLTPVNGKKTQAESSTTISVDKKPAAKPAAKPQPKPAPAETAEPDENAPEEEAPAPKKPAPKPQKAEPMKMMTPKPGKHAPGLVPPPPPVLSFPTMMAVPAPVPPPSKPKAAAQKKEEKPKEAAPKEDKASETKGGADEDDFLLDWGGAKDKKKK